MCTSRPAAKVHLASNRMRVHRVEGEPGLETTTTTVFVLHRYNRNRCTGLASHGLCGMVCRRIWGDQRAAISSGRDDGRLWRTARAQFLPKPEFQSGEHHTVVLDVAGRLKKFTDLRRKGRVFLRR